MFNQIVVGTLSVCVFSFVLSYLVFKALKATVGLRISKAAEKQGTDKSEIGVDFTLFWGKKKVLEGENTSTLF